MNLVQKFYSIPNDEREDFFYKEVIKKGRSEAFHKAVPLFFEKRDKANKTYDYMLTFTLDPKKHAFNDAYYDKVEKYIRRLSDNKAWLLSFFAIVREGGDEEHKHTHWHVRIRCKKYFDSCRNLAYYRRLYGNVDFSVSKVSTNLNAKTYMSKQCEPTVLLGCWDDDKLDQSQHSQISQIES